MTGVSCDGGDPAPGRRDLVRRLEDLVEALRAGLVVHEGAGLLGVGGDRQYHAGAFRRGGLQGVEHDGALDVAFAHTPGKVVLDDHRHRTLACAVQRGGQRQAAAEQGGAVAVGLRGRHRQHRVPAPASKRQGDIGRGLYESGSAGFAAGDHERPFGGREGFSGRRHEGVEGAGGKARVDGVGDAEGGPCQVDGIAVAGRGGQFVDARGGHGRDEHRALGVLPVAAYAGVLPLGDAGGIGQVEGRPARCLADGQGDPGRRVRHVLAENQHGVGLLDVGERGNPHAGAVGVERRGDGLRLVVGHSGTEVLGTDEGLQGEVRFEGSPWRTDADDVGVLQSCRGGGKRGIAPGGFEYAVGGAHPRMADALVVVHEVRPVAAAVAQEVAVDLAVVAVVHPLQQTVAFGREGVAAHRAVGADGRRRLEIPLAGVGLGERLVGEHPRGTDLHQVAGELAFEHAVLLATEKHPRARAEGVEILAAGVLPVVAHAAIAGDAAVHLVADEGAEVLVLPGSFATGVAAHGVAGHHGHVLEVALAALLAHRAVVGMVLHQPLDHLSAEVGRESAGARRLALGSADADTHAVLHRHQARHLQPSALVGFVLVLDDRAQPAGAHRPHGRVPAEIGEV